MLCRHCVRFVANRPRRLCWRCFAQPEVRGRYPPLGAASGVGADHDAEPLPALEPTAACPGSEAKIRIMAARAERGEQIFHPLDAGVRVRHTALAAAG